MRIVSQQLELSNLLATVLAFKTIVWVQFTIESYELTNYPQSLAENVMNFSNILFTAASISGKSSNVIEFNATSPTSHHSHNRFLYFWWLWDWPLWEEFNVSCFGPQLNGYVAGQRLIRRSLLAASIYIHCIFPSATCSNLVNEYSLVGPRPHNAASEGTVGSVDFSVFSSLPTVM